MAQGIDAPGAVSRNQVNDRVAGRAPDDNPTDTAKQNYTEVGWSNDKGSIRLGHVHKQGDVTAGVILQTPDAEHQLSLDIDGPRKGCAILYSNVYNIYEYGYPLYRGTTFYYIFVNSSFNL